MCIVFVSNSNAIQTVVPYGLDTIIITRKKICTCLLQRQQGTLLNIFNNPLVESTDEVPVDMEN